MPRKSSALQRIENAYHSGGVAAAIHAFLALFPERNRSHALVFIERQGWI